MKLLKRSLSLYLDKKAPRAAAALSYYLTMTLFPMIICLYALFGQNYAAAMRIFEAVKVYLTPDSAQMIKTFLIHVATSRGRAIILAAVTTLLTSSSAALRVTLNTISEMQGGTRFRAMTDFALSFLLAMAMLLFFGLAIVVMLTGRNVLRAVHQRLPLEGIAIPWGPLRFVLLAAVVFGLLSGLFSISRRKCDRYRILPGAVLATAGIVSLSGLFSVLIGRSTRYSLVYGSLASIILLMLWLYLVCQIILLGAAFNISQSATRTRYRSPKS